MQIYEDDQGSSPMVECGGQKIWQFFAVKNLFWENMFEKDMDTLRRGSGQQNDLLPKALKGNLMRTGYRLLVVVFPVLKIFVPEFRSRPCYWQTVFMFNSLSPERRKKCSINILIDICPLGEPWGHAWLTINGKRLGRLHPRLDQSRLNGRMEHIGSAGIFEYWAMVPVTELQRPNV